MNFQSETMKKICRALEVLVDDYYDAKQRLKEACSTIHTGHTIDEMFEDLDVKSITSDEFQEKYLQSFRSPYYPDDSDDAGRSRAALAYLEYKDCQKKRADAQDLLNRYDAEFKTKEPK